jgi:hypothetical protein
MYLRFYNLSYNNTKCKFCDKKIPSIIMPPRALQMRQHNRRQAESANTPRRSGGQPDRSAPLQPTLFAKSSDPNGGMIVG